MRLKKTYSSREVARLTGVTARQLQLWDAGRLLSAAIPSRRTEAGGYTERRYTPIDVFELLVLAELRRLGLSVAVLHAIVRALRETFGVSLFEATGGGTAVRLLTNGRDVFARTEEGQFYSLLDTPAQPLLVIGDERLLKTLSGQIRSPRKSRKDSGAKARAPGGAVSRSGRSSRVRPKDEE
jgi:DNA-binding transcriptional MerR regulator